MDIRLLLVTLFMILLAVTLMLGYRPPKNLRKNHLGVWSSVILAAVAVLGMT